MQYFSFSAWLISFNTMPSSWWKQRDFYYFSWKKNIPLCTHTSFSFPLICWQILRFFFFLFFCSSAFLVQWAACQSHIFSVVSTAKMNMWVELALWYSVFINSVVCPEVGLLDHMIVLLLIFWGNFIVFSSVAALLSISLSDSTRYQSRVFQAKKIKWKIPWSYVSQGRFILLPTHSQRAFGNV